MAIALVIAWTGSQLNGVSSPATNTGVDTTGANFIGVSVTCDTAVTSVSDSKGNTYTLSAAHNSGGGDSVYEAHCESPTVGTSHTISVNFAGAGHFVTICAAAYSGMAASSTADKTTAGTGTGTALSSGATAATTQADELVLGGATLAAVASLTWTAGGSYTVRSQVTNGAIGGVGVLEDQIVAATGAQTATLTSSQSGGWDCWVATFKGTGGGGVTVKSLAAMGVG